MAGAVEIPSRLRKSRRMVDASVRLWLAPGQEAIEASAINRVARRLVPKVARNSR
jgi:hypothetical protein